MIQDVYKINILEEYCQINIKFDNILLFCVFIVKNIDKR